MTPASISDAEGLKRVCPKEGMRFADKAYSVKEAQATIKANSCHSGAILKNNMKYKNKKKYKWISQVRSTFENTFSKLSKKSRYRGIAKKSISRLHGSNNL